MTTLDRRTFIRKSFQASLATAAAGSLPMLDLLALPALAASPPPLAVRKGAEIPQLVHRAIEIFQYGFAHQRSLLFLPVDPWERACPRHDSKTA